jgi:predicted nucleotide-binding protein
MPPPVGPNGLLGSSKLSGGYNVGMDARRHRATLKGWRVKTVRDAGKRHQLVKTPVKRNQEMVDQTSLLHRLDVHLNELRQLPQSWSAWPRYEAWAAKVGVCLRQNCPGHVQAFEDLSREPTWHPTHGLMETNDWKLKGEQNAVNSGAMRRSRDNLLGFMESLVKEVTAIRANLPKVETPRPESAASGHKMPDSKRVFVIYGRNQNAYNQMVLFLRALKLDPKPFLEVAGELAGIPSVFDIVRHGMNQAAGVVALFTPDEWAALRPTHNLNGETSVESRRWQSRPNVIFEAGLAIGLDPEKNRTILVKLGQDVSLFSDVGGIHTVDLNNGHASRNYLRDKLRAAGCIPDMETGEHLHIDRAGNFEDCVQFPDEQAPEDPFRRRGRKK